MSRKEHTTKVVMKIYADGTTDETECEMTLHQMQQFVGGYIEMVPSSIPHRALIVNEDGLGLELPHNVKATEYLASTVLVLDLIRGNDLLVKWM